MLNANAVK